MVWFPVFRDFPGENTLMIRISAFLLTYIAIIVKADRIVSCMWCQAKPFFFSFLNFWKKHINNADKLPGYLSICSVKMVWNWGHTILWACLWRSSSEIKIWNCPSSNKPLLAAAGHRQHRAHHYREFHKG